MSRSRNPGNQTDPAWKIAIELFLEPFLLLCFPAVHALIDWSRAPQFRAGLCGPHRGV